MVNNVTDWIERLKNRLREQNLTEAEFAKIIDVNRGQLSNWLTGKRNPKLEKRLIMADALGVSLHWLDTGEDLIPDSELPQEILDNVEALVTELGNKETRIHRGTGLRIIPGKSDRSFLIRLDNDSMLDPNRGDKVLIPEGASVQIDTDIDPTPGCIVLLRYNGKMMLRVWKRISNSEHIFQVINPLYTSLNFNFEGDISEIYVGTAVGCSFKLL